MYVWVCSMFQRKHLFSFRHQRNKWFDLTRYMKSSLFQTFLFFGNNTLSMSEEYFERPEEFRPERWLPGAHDPQTQRLMGLCVLPFGMGKRNCLGRRFAEQEIHLAAIKVGIQRVFMHLLYRTFGKAGELSIYLIDPPLKKFYRWYRIYRFLYN